MKRNTLSITFFSFIAVLCCFNFCILFEAFAQSTSGLGRNGRWFTYNGQYKYFVGFDTQELAADTRINYIKVLDDFIQYGINKGRLWVYPWFKLPQPEGPYLAPWTYIKSGTDYKHNLDSWNAAYWQKMREVVAAAKSRGIVMEITIFGPNNLKKYEHFSNSAWKSAENKIFNVNGVFSANSHGHLVPQFFDLNHGELSSSGKNLKYYQQRLIDKTVAELGSFDNVYFELANEFPVSSDTTIFDNYHGWQLHWGKYINAATSRLITIHSHSNAGSHNYGIQKYWDEPYIDVMNFHFYETNPKKLSDFLHGAQTKAKALTVNESGKFYGTELDGQTRFAWGMFLSGGYFALYWDDIVNNVTSDAWKAGAQRLQILRNIVETLKFWEMSPVDASGNEYDSLITQGPSGTNKQLIANPGKEYLAYFWGTKSTTPVKLSLPQGSYTYKWHDPRTGGVLLSGSVQGSSTATITAPPTTTWSEVVGVALIIRNFADTTAPSAPKSLRVINQ